LLFKSYWHIDEKIRLPIGVDMQKPTQLEGKTCMLGTDHDKNHPSPKPKGLQIKHKS
jgi:hypothetical protein